MFAFQWTDRLTIVQEAPLADTPNWFEGVLAQLGIPEIMLVVGMGVVVSMALDTIGQRGIGKMCMVVAVFNAVQILVQRLAAVAEAFK